MTVRGDRERRTDLAAAGAPPAPVPLLDPRRVYPAWGPQAERAAVEVLRSHAYVRGAQVAAFEAELATYVGTPHAVALDSGTDALVLVLRAWFERDPARREVVLPAFTFIATAGAVVLAGGVPVFADVDPATFNLDPASVAARVGPRTAAVIAVHLFGAPADVAAVRAAAGGLPVLEDAAQALGGRVGATRVGALGDAATHSFYPSKNLAAAGDAGAVTTADADLAAALRALREHGAPTHETVGTNSRLDELQAAVLRAKLPHLDAWNARRQEIAARYAAAFDGTPVVPQAVRPGARSSHHLYTVRLPRRDAVRARLEAAGIGHGLYYERALTQQPCFASPAPAPCPRAEALCDEVLSLPCFPGLTDEEQDRVIEAVRTAVGPSA